MGLDPYRQGPQGPDFGTYLIYRRSTVKENSIDLPGTSAQDRSNRKERPIMTSIFLLSNRICSRKEVFQPHLPVTATLLRLSPSYRSCPRPLLTVTDFRHSRLPWLDGRCVQGPGTYSPDHG